MRTETVPTPQTVEEVLNLDSEDFRALVDVDVRTEPNPMLRDPRVVTRWFEYLLINKRSIEGQFGAEKKRMAALLYQTQQDPGNDELQERLAAERVRYAQWKAGALRFNSGLEMRIHEARSLLPRDNPSHLHQEISRLRFAIKQHKNEIEPDAASEADEELWSLVE